MKKLILIAILLVAGMATEAMAQATANATTTVLSPLSITRNSHLVFGNILQGATKSVAVEDAAAAKFTITGTGSTGVDVTYTLPTELTGPGDPIAFNGGTVEGSSTDDASAASAVNNADTVTLSAGGNFYLWVGGSITAAPTQVTGAYSGQMTFNVAYP